MSIPLDSSTDSSSYLSGFPLLMTDTSAIDRRIRRLEQEQADIGIHVDTLYDRYYDLMNDVARLKERASTIQTSLPLKYK